LEIAWLLVDVNNLSLELRDLLGFGKDINKRECKEHINYDLYSSVIIITADDLTFR
jgi:hypothetical protein